MDFHKQYTESIQALTILSVVSVKVNNLIWFSNFQWNRISFCFQIRKKFISFYLLNDIFVPSFTMFSEPAYSSKPLISFSSLTSRKQQKYVRRNWNETYVWNKFIYFVSLQINLKYTPKKIFLWWYILEY